MTDKNLKMIGYSGQKKKAPASSKKMKQAYAALILGLLLIPGGLMVTGLIQGLIDDEIGNFIKTPKPSDEGYSDFLTDERDDAIPMYTNYYMHNLTNANATLHGAKPVFDEIGPYCYRVYSYKYDVSFNDDFSEVTYKGYSKYEYQHELSGDGLDPTDIIQNINPGYLGVLNLMDPTLQNPERTLVNAMLPSILSMVKVELLNQIETMLGEIGIPGLDPLDIFYWDWAEDWGPPGFTRWILKGVLDDMGIDLDGQMIGINNQTDPDHDDYMGQADDLSIVARGYDPIFIFLPDLGDNEIKSNITKSQFIDLWDEDNPNSLTGFDPFANPIWTEAIAGSEMEKLAIESAFGLVRSQVNLITAWLSTAIQNYGWMSNLANFQIEQWESDILTVRTVDEWLFSGIDTLIDMVEPSMAKVGIFSSLESEWDADLAGTTSNTYNTGQTNINDIGTYVKFEGKTVITDWNVDIPLSGTSGTQFAPGVTKDEDLEIFIPQFLRPLSVEYSKDVTVKGVDLLEYILPVDAFPIDTTTFNDDVEGLANMGVAYGAPVYLGQPHFYGADPDLLDNVNISAPNQDSHQLYIDVEPNTGATMAARLRMGIYMKVTQTDFWYKDITEAIYPVFWLEQTAEIPDDLASMFKDLVYMVLDLKAYIHAGFVGGGAALLCVGIVVMTTQRRKIKTKKLEKFESQKKEFFQYKQELQKYKESKMVLPENVPKKKKLDQTK